MGFGKDAKLRSSKYLNNIIEQDHRGVKARIGPMLGFKRFRRAKVTIAGIELLHRTRKNQGFLRPTDGSNSVDNFCCHLWYCRSICEVQQSPGMSAMNTDQIDYHSADFSNG
jgi:DDE domain